MATYQGREIPPERRLSVDSGDNESEFGTPVGYIDPHAYRPMAASQSLTKSDDDGRMRPPTIVPLKPVV
ncbi:hypothetical protein [Mycolicibacterium sp. P9-22]|uniref:hypothetical protein n=1 Tax=Mycolicibacterium sp. P9-22 TaxID=2024613 RepID=UPI0011EF886E|nr:hypothetical protein [Mycolicibacterium sp. P9-22]